ncbi:MAG: GH36-type glycosyl hydrolase domain-containing protein, partial [Candidatus Binatia bacterium]
MLIASVPPFDRLNDSAPHARLLSNGTYSVLLTSAGSGYSWWHDTALSGWWADRTEDADGVFLYLRDAEDGAVWSAAHQPCPDGAERYAAHAAPGLVTIERRQHGIESRLEVAVAADADVEVRRLTLHNDSGRARRIEVTSALEVVLNQSAAHAAHPAFSKLFVQTELDTALGALLARRRARSAGEHPPWMGQALLGPGALQCETDRARFRGRNRTPADPQGLHAALSGTVGSVLDPLFGMRRTVELPAGGSATLVLLLAAAADGSALRAILQRASAAGYADAVLADPARPALALDGAPTDAALELAGALLY